MPFVDGGLGEEARNSEAVGGRSETDDGGGGGEAGSCLNVISSSSLWTIVEGAAPPPLAEEAWTFFALLLSLPFPAMAPEPTMPKVFTWSLRCWRVRLSRLTRFVAVALGWSPPTLGLPPLDGAHVAGDVGEVRMGRAPDIERAGFCTAMIWPPLVERTCKIYIEYIMLYIFIIVIKIIVCITYDPWEWGFGELVLE